MKKQLAAVIILAVLLGGMAGFGEMLFDSDKSSSVAYEKADEIEDEKSNTSSTAVESSTSESTDDSTDDSTEVIEFDASEAISTLNVDEMFTNNELTLTYDETDATVINLSNESVTITEEGTYILSGTISDGQIIIDVGDSDKVHLVLDGVDISCSSSAAIYIKQADKVFITLADDSYNILSVTGEYDTADENNVDGVIFAKSDISFLGSGSLEINANCGHGIVGKDDVVFMDGVYIITAQNHGISANDSIRIASGDFTIISGKDGMKADNDEDPEKGYIYIADGSVNITAEQDGISSSSMIQIDGGSFCILSGGGYVEVLNELTVGEGSGNMTQVTDTLEYSMKSIKACNILINDGDMYVSSYEDALHADYDMTINGGTLCVLSGDDAVHAENTLIINDVELTIEESYEGIEACYIYLNGGNISVTAYDDAVNATESYGSLTVTGGDIYITCVGDGIDSNGDLYIEGGNIVIDCNPIYSGGDGDVDVSGEVSYTGGTITDSDGNAIDPTASMSGGMNSFFQMVPSSGSSSKKR